MWLLPPKLLLIEFFYRFGALPADIDSQLAHNGNCFRSDRGRLHACAFYFEVRSGIMAQQSFRHLAACGITGAEN